MSRFTPNTNMHDELRREPQMRKAMVGEGREVASRAEALDHNIMPRKRSRGNFKVDAAGGTVRVVNTSHGGHIDEFGSANNRPYAPLRRAVRAAGLRLREALRR